MSPSFERSRPAARLREVDRQRAQLDIDQTLVIAEFFCDSPHLGIVTFAHRIRSSQSKNDTRIVLRRSVPSKVCSHVGRGRCCMSSGPFVGRSGGHSPDHRDATGNPRCDHAARSASPDPAHTTSPSPHATSASTPRCASRPEPTTGSPPRYPAVERDVVRKRRDVRTIPSLDLDHVSRIRIPKQQRPTQPVVRLRPRMVTGSNHSFGCT